MTVRDTLFLLEDEFADPAFPGETFYCRDCIMVAGLLAAFPQKAADIDVVRVSWPRPRAVVVEAIGDENQNLPALAFAEGGHVNDLPRLLEALHQRHGFLRQHP